MHKAAVPTNPKKVQNSDWQYLQVQCYRQNIAHKAFGAKLALAILYPLSTGGKIVLLKKKTFKVI